MDKSLIALCGAIKKILHTLKPQQHPLSFILLTGKRHQGKSTLMQQSHMERYHFKEENNADIYHNEHGIIVDLGESWLNISTNILQYTLKQLNHCHKHIKITGIACCIDLHELCDNNPTLLMEQCHTHTKFLQRFGESLGYPVDLAIFFTKVDLIAGFCEFFQQEHEIDLKKPLGFSLPTHPSAEHAKEAFSQFIESLGQSVVNKIHPVRSSVKRTLIREFPLQLASLSPVILRLFQHISPKYFHLQAFYFTSAEQGGLLIDRLHNKIQHEYALTLQDNIPQSINYRPYFLEGALLAFQRQTQKDIPRTLASFQWIVISIGVITGLCIGIIIHQYIQSSQLLDNASKELIAYDTLMHQKNNTTAASQHLAKATRALHTLTAHVITPTSVQTLHQQLKQAHAHQLDTYTVPLLLKTLEQEITGTHTSHIDRYHALKIYLMLAHPSHEHQNEIILWYQTHWKEKKSHVDLLKQVIQREKALPVNQQIIRDARNYLNALPANYLYYSLVKPQFSTQTIPLHMPGFVTATASIPVYVTQSGFQHVMTQLPHMTQQLQAENWVLERQDLDDLLILLQQAYCYEYVIWWQNFMKHTHPQHVQNYHQAHLLVGDLHNHDTFTRLVQLISQHTNPTSGPHAHLFNQEVASQFTELSLMSPSSVQKLTMTLAELSKFLHTFSMVHDQGKTAFQFTKARFQGEGFANPLNTLYQEAAHLPEPMGSWAKQIADDTWFTLINDSREYINHQWQHVYQDYQTTIAHRFPFDANSTQDVNLTDFDRFFAPSGVLNHFVTDYIKPFLDVSKAQWQLKTKNGYVLPISTDMINELIRANVITNMFFPHHRQTSHIHFSLQKLGLDPIVAKLRLSLGDTQLVDTQNTESFMAFDWPQANATLKLRSIEGNEYELEELGPWAFFKMLQKVNVLVDEENSAHLEILFEINGNSGRYLLKTDNQVNPFIPGILNGFMLGESIV